MRRLSALAPIMLSILLSSVECRAQSGTAETLSPPILPANTPVILRLTKNLYKRDAKRGQPVEFEVAFDVVVNGEIFIPSGAAVTGSLRQVDRTGKGPAKVLIDLGPAQTVSGEMVRLAWEGTTTASDQPYGVGDAVLVSGETGPMFPVAMPVFVVASLFEKKVLLDTHAGCGWFNLGGCGVWVIAHVAESVVADPVKLKAAQAPLLRQSFRDTDIGLFYLYASYPMGRLEPLSESSPNGQENKGISRPLFSLLVTANRLETAGDLDGAITECQQAIVLKPDSPELRVLLAEVFQKKGEFDHAIEQLRQVVALRPGSSKAHVFLAELFQEKGDFVEAIEQLQQAVALRPGSSEAHVLRAKLFQEKGDFVHAIAEYRTAVAIAEFRAAVQLDPKGEHTREGFVTSLVESDDPDAALAEIREAMRLWPENIYFHFILGRLLVKKNDPDGAIAELQWALKQWKNQSWQTNCELGRAYERKGDLKAALGQYRTAYRVHMDDKECRAAYERLHSQLKK